MNLLDANWKNIISDALRDIHDTFARDHAIRFYKEVAVLYVADANYNADFQRKTNNKNIKTEVSEEFTARIWYLDRQERETFLPGDDTDLRWSNDVNRIRVQIPIAGLAYLEAATRFEFNGKKWQKEGSVSQIGFHSVLEYAECHLSQVS